MVHHTWITLPAGPFIMGSDPRDAAPLFANERPLHRLSLPAFPINRVPITNAQYQQFIAATGYCAPAHWRNGEPPTAQENFPITYVTWHDAQIFCDWRECACPLSSIASARTPKIGKMKTAYLKENVLPGQNQRQPDPRVTVNDAFWRIKKCTEDYSL